MHLDILKDDDVDLYYPQNKKLSQVSQNGAPKRWLREQEAPSEVKGRLPHVQTEEGQGTASCEVL
jgi:hypothetical protein